MEQENCLIKNSVVLQLFKGKQIQCTYVYIRLPLDEVLASMTI